MQGCVEREDRSTLTASDYSSHKGGHSAGHGCLHDQPLVSIYGIYKVNVLSIEQYSRAASPFSDLCNLTAFVSFIGEFSELGKTMTLGFFPCRNEVESKNFLNQKSSLMVMFRQQRGSGEPSSR